MSNVNGQRSLFGFLVAGAIALLIIAAGFYWFFAKTPVKFFASTSQPNATIFVSKLAPVTVSLLTNPERLQSFERKGELSQLKTSLLAKSGIDYKQDIQPWLGNEITLSVTTVDIDRDPENGRQPGYLMALATEKPEQSREFLDLLFSRRVLAGANLAVEQYKGVKLISDNSQPQQDSLAGAVVDGFVLFANNPKVLRDAINNVQAPDLNLSSSSKYQKAAQQLPKASLATAFLNLPAVAEWQGLELPEATFHSQIISLSLNPKGLLAETNFLTDSEIISAAPPLTQPVGALEYIPDAAGLVISSSHLNNLGNSDLAQLWTQVKTAFSDSGTDAISSLVKPLAELQKNQGINLVEDIFGWVTGEYALAVLPHAGESAADWVFVVEKLEDVPEGISRLDAIASSRGLSISSFNWNQQKIFAWTELTAATKQTDTQERRSFAIEAKVQGVHTTLGKYEIFASNLETLDEVITTKESALIGNSNFQDIIAAIPQPNQGYVYLDWTKSQTLLERQLPILQLVEIVGKPLFQNLRSLTISSYGHEEGLLKGGVLFRFLD
ncbi:hypothetical protein A2T98_11060 [Nodularia spumigena CENA596]|uniref:DUF3352 domain-containing protein n=1 Tax=Nodularia spumigena CENA596 TaxID=1819295 RepID=A0A166JJN7_NODSP|nr:DUF3352 domain-containing protein [Nodularia spumigena]KZL49791.1 hypothetical protein A2T98_11060 [Nodularia spumigena CENA596]